MKFSHIRPLATILIGLALGSCGGGGGSDPAPTPSGSSGTPTANNAPTSLDDSLSVVVNTPTNLDLTGNDSDSDGTIASLSIVQSPASGSVTANGVTVTYTPDSDFVGTDEFTYQVRDNDSALGNVATVTLMVTPITATSLSVLSLAIPQSGYTSQNNAELGATVLTSAPIGFSMPANAVSFSIALVGPDVNSVGDKLFIASVQQPAGQNLSPLERTVTFCDPGYCSGLVPRAAPLELASGDWTISVGTLAATTNAIDLGSMSLSVAVRIGPQPTTGSSTRLRVRPHLAASSLTPNDLESILNQLSAMALASGLELVFDVPVVITDPQFTEVSRNFSDPDTAALVSSGAPDKINLFFLENFSGAGGAGLLGISGGLPGTFGEASAFNGILINATATQSQPGDVSARNTAEIAFHEMGHFLGLYHTTERQFNLHDVIADTPECLPANDRSAVGTPGVAEVNECPDGQNLMFWNTDFSGNKLPLSPQQSTVIAHSPIAQPGS